MEWYFTLLAGIMILFVLFLSGAPIFLAFLFAILIGVYFIIGPFGFPMFVNSILDTATTTSLASIPLFILMGELLFRSGTMDVLFDSIDKLVGRVRGRQYVLVVVLSAVFGALSGVAMAVAAMLGRAIMPGMVARGYDRDIAAGLIIAGANHPTKPFGNHSRLIGGRFDCKAAHRRCYPRIASRRNFLSLCIRSDRAKPRSCACKCFQ